MTTQTYVEQLEQRRDLRRDMSGLGREEEQEILFQEWSPGRTIVSLWSTETGEEIVIPRYMADAAISLPRADGKGYRFTSHKDKAPTLKENSVHCFMHPEAPERELVVALGITKTCPAAKLASNYSKRVHAQHRHKAEWGMYQEHVSEERDTEWRKQQQETTEAMLALAGSKKGKKDVASE